MAREREREGGEREREGGERKKGEREILRKEDKARALCIRTSSQSRFLMKF